MPLHRAIKDQGIENFSFEVMNILIVKDHLFMDEYDSICNGYNIKHSICMFDLY